MPAGAVIVGAGHAGFQCAAALRAEGYSGAVSLVCGEPGLPYQRPPLSKGLLAGKVAQESLAFRDAGWYADNAIGLVHDRAVVIDRVARRLQLRDAPALDYEHLVLATGARPRSLAVPGAEVAHVLDLRTREDAARIRASLTPGSRLAIVGAGFIGLEIAATARALGCEVWVLEAAARALARSVSAATAAFLADRHAASGVSLRFGAAIERLDSSGGRAIAVGLRGGERLACDTVVVGIGVAPDASLARACGLPASDGVLVDDMLRTEDPAISAIGDCARFPAAGATLRLESVQNAADQARCVAARIAGRAQAYRKVPWFWSDQGELRLQIAGLANGHDSTVVRGDPASGRFSVFCFRGGRVIAVESVNRPADHMAARRLLDRGAALTAVQAADVGFDLKACEAAAL